MSFLFYLIISTLSIQVQLTRYSLKERNGKVLKIYMDHASLLVHVLLQNKFLLDPFCAFIERGDQLPVVKQPN